MPLKLEELNHPSHSKLGQSIKYNERLRDDELAHQPFETSEQLFEFHVRYKIKMRPALLKHLLREPNSGVLPVELNRKIVLIVGMKGLKDALVAALGLPVVRQRGAAIQP